MAHHSIKIISQNVGTSYSELLKESSTRQGFRIQLDPSFGTATAILTLSVKTADTPTYREFAKLKVGEVYEDFGAGLSGCLVKTNIFVKSTHASTPILGIVKDPLETSYL
jgi:hypothetical protein